MKERVLVLSLGLCAALILLEIVLRTVGFFHETMRPGTFETKPGTRVILCTGDSLTYGYGLPREQSYPAQLEKMLKAEGRDFKVVNLGRIAGASWMLAENIEGYLDYFKPDLVTVMIGRANKYRYSLPNEQKSSLLMKLLSYSRALNLVHMLTANSRQKLPEISRAFRVVWDRITGSHGHLSVNPADTLLTNIPGATVCSIDYPRFSGEVWDLARSKDLKSLNEKISKKSRPETEEITAQGVAYLLNGDYGQACSVFENAIAIRGKCYQFSVGLGLCDLLQYKATSASACFLDALAMEPGDTGAMLCLGATMLLKGERDSAQLWFEKVLKIDPLNGWAYNFLGRSSLDVQDLENAERYYLEGIRIEPELTMNYTSLGDLYSHTKDFSAARQILEKALNKGIGLNWEKSRALLVLAVSESCLDPVNSIEKTKEYLMEAVRCDQRNYPALTFLITTFGGQEVMQSIIDSLEKSGHQNAAFFLRHGLGDNALLYEPIKKQLQIDLDLIIGICRKKGVQLLFVNYPNDENPVMRELSREQNVLFIDVLDAFNKLWVLGGKRWDYFLPNLDCSELGNRKIAEILKSKVSELLPDEPKGF
ncbi:MAG: GDSL-type esterase/lipase family protein [Candidatus Wallbacteria bacterium]|nr:GDSL-type esterase/lipase family protein [Candidatus Wallbacteria bacterium]